MFCENSSVHELTFNELSCEEILPLRTRILRPHFSPNTFAHFAEDELSQTLHFGLSTPEHEIVAVATIFPQKFPYPTEYDPSTTALQLRGMAVDASFQNRGLGKTLVEGMLAELTLRFPVDSILWCRARQSAVGFYARLGFHTSGAPFDVADIGQHIVMSRGFLAMPS